VKYEYKNFHWSSTERTTYQVSHGSHRVREFLNMLDLTFPMVFRYVEIKGEEARAKVVLYHLNEKQVRTDGLTTFAASTFIPLSFFKPSNKNK